MNTKNLFGYLLSAFVLLVTIMALLGIWDVIDWSYFERYFGKSVKSMVVITISAIVLYIIQSLLVKKTEKSTSNSERYSDGKMNS